MTESPLVDIPHEFNQPVERNVAAGSEYSYSSDQKWQQLQQFLPASYHMSVEEAPKESVWTWCDYHVHVERYANPDAKAKVILLHGVGTNSRQLSLIVGKPLAKAGLESIAIDLPPYGLSVNESGMPILYDDWVEIVIRFVQYEQQRDGRPIILYGLSAGGMLAYHVAAKYPHIAGIIGMTFLDQRIQQVRDQTSKNLLMSRLGTALARFASATPIGNIKIPMQWVCKMNMLVNQPEALKLMLKDGRSAGNSNTLKFLSSYMYYQPAIDPQDFTTCPVLLTQPEDDHWTPLALSQLTLNKIRYVPVHICTLPHAGHYPLEQEGLTALKQHILAFVEEVVVAKTH